jgi:glycosyltransferase involved in cell wall biosynthesis
MKKALVYNRFLNTAGGGERLTLDWCLALSQLGYHITLVTASTFQGSIQDLCDVFGIQGASSWHLKILNEEAEIADFCRAHSFDLFVNGTFCSLMPNPAPCGIYSLMFPQHLDQLGRDRLLTYQRIICISDFSEIYVRHWWGEDLPVRTLPPPISDSHMKATGISFEGKEKIILNVGRFNIHGHCKRQLEAIRCFQEMLFREIIDDGWQLFCVGNLNNSPENVEYVETCRREAGANVCIETDVSFSRLQGLYRRAAALWQFTGSHLKSGETPQYCEHLGLVAMDSMCYGTIPMVYQRSGVAFVINHATSGFIFETTDELARIMAVFDRAFGSKEHNAMFEASRASAAELGFESFKSRLSAHVWEISR